jgi:hypothetical protein
VPYLDANPSRKNAFPTTDNRLPTQTIKRKFDVSPATLREGAQEPAIEASISLAASARQRSTSPPSKLLSGDLGSMPLFESQSASLSLGEELPLESLEQRPIEILPATDLAFRSESDVQASEGAGAEARSNDDREDGQLPISPENPPPSTERVQDMRRRFEQMAARAADSSADARLPARHVRKGAQKSETH